MTGNIEPPERWMSVPCDWCGSSNSEFVMRGPDLLHDLPGEFTLVRCSDCGLIRQDPQLRWEFLEAYYPTDYAAYEPIIETVPRFFRRLDRRYGMWKRIKAVEALAPTGNLLDVGAGTGIFLAEAYRSGIWHVTGLEPNHEAALYIRQNLSVPIIEAPFDQADFAGEKFDVITMWNVLEHFYYPIDELERAHNLLKPGGLLVFSIPNLNSIEARLFGPAWLGWDLPRHIYQFPLDVLEEILSELGFDLVRMSCVATAHAALGLSILFWLKAHNLESSALGRFVLWLYHARLARLALAPPLKLMDLMRLSSLIVMFCRKTEASAA